MRSKKPAMRAVTFLTAIIVLTLWQVATRGQAAPVAQAPSPAPSVGEKVDAVFARWDSTGTPGCTVAVSVKGQVVLSRAYGMADLEHGAVMTPETILEAGSVSKQFTAAAVLLLARDGKLSLDDSPRKYVPELALWSGVANGMLDSIGTDHCPFTHEQKKMGLGDFTKIPNGAAGIEDRLAVLYTHGVKGGHFSLERLVELGSAAPARIFGLTKKGSVAVGMDADLVVFDPSPRRVLSARTHHSRADRNIFEGLDVQGRIERTIVGGRVAFENGKLMAEKGSGRFIARKPTHFATHAEVNARAAALR